MSPGGARHENSLRQFPQLAARAATLPAVLRVGRAKAEIPGLIKHIQEKGMLKVGLSLGIATLLATTSLTQAQAPIERGSYLVNGLLTCGNCHTPRGPGGVFAMDRQLSGALHGATPGRRNSDGATTLTR